MKHLLIVFLAAVLNVVPALAEERPTRVSAQGCALLADMMLVARGAANVDLSPEVADAILADVYSAQLEGGGAPLARLMLGVRRFAYGAKGSALEVAATFRNGCFATQGDVSILMRPEV